MAARERGYLVYVILRNKSRCIHDLISNTNVIKNIIPVSTETGRAYE